MSPSVILAFPSCHPRRLSPTPVPDLIGDPVKEWIQSSKGSRVFSFVFLLLSVIPAFPSCHPRHPPLCHPRRLSPTPVPDLIGDPVKEWIQSSKGSSVFVFSFSQPTTLDSCFRRNDSFGLSFAIFMPIPPPSSPLVLLGHPAQNTRRVILSNAKDLLCPLLSSSTLVIEDPGSFPSFVAAASRVKARDMPHAARALSSPGRPWFWVLLPKQKDLVARGRNPANAPLRSVMLATNA